MTVNCAWNEIACYGLRPAGANGQISVTPPRTRPTIRPHFQPGKLHFCSSRTEVRAFRAKEKEELVTANRWLQLTH
jgi:hypothetical protein